MDEHGKPMPKGKSRPSRLPKKDMKGTVIYRDRAAGRSAYMLIQWETGKINAYTMMWQYRFKDIIKPGSQVEFRAINESSMRISGIPISIDKTIKEGTVGFDLNQFKKIIDSFRSRFS